MKHKAKWMGLLFLTLTALLLVACSKVGVMTQMNPTKKVKAKTALLLNMMEAQPILIKNPNV